MSEYYLCSTLLWDSPLEEIVRFVYENGLDGIEMWAQQWMVKGYSFEEYKRLTALYPVKTFVHSSSWDLNPASLNEGIRRASVEEIKKSIRLAAQIGAYEVTVHPGRITLCHQEDAYYGRMQESLKEILETASKEHVDVSLEIMEQIPKEFVTSVEAMKKIAGEMYEDFYYTLDIAHCEGEEAVGHALAECSRFSKFHISNRKGNRYHTPLPEGDYDFYQLLPQLENYRLPFVIEGFDASADHITAGKNLAFLKTYGGIRK